MNPWLRLQNRLIKGGSLIPVAIANWVSGVVAAVTESIVTEAAWTVLVGNQVFDAVTTAVNSAVHNVTGYSGLRVNVYVISAGAPTDVRVLPQFSNDNGITWWDFEEGLWASLYWEDTDVAAGVFKNFLLPVAGEDRVRFRVVTTGTGAGVTFTVSIAVRAFRGHTPVAHS